jgi:hypothetical protein
MYQVGSYSSPIISVTPNREHREAGEESCRDQICPTADAGLVTVRKDSSSFVDGIHQFTRIGR